MTHRPSLGLLVWVEDLDLIMHLRVVKADLRPRKTTQTVTSLCFGCLHTTKATRPSADETVGAYSFEELNLFSYVYVSLGGGRCCVRRHSSIRTQRPTTHLTGAQYAEKPMPGGKHTQPRSNDIIGAYHIGLNCR